MRLQVFAHADEAILDGTLQALVPLIDTPLPVADRLQWPAKAAALNGLFKPVPCDLQPVHYQGTKSFFKSPHCVMEFLAVWNDTLRRFTWGQGAAVSYKICNGQIDFVADGANDGYPGVVDGVRHA